MYCLLVAPCTAVAILAKLFAAPLPGEPANPYLPPVVGAKWVYREDDNEDTLSVVAVEYKGRARLVTLARDEKGDGTFITRMLAGQVSVSADGLRRVWTPGPSSLMLRLPHEPGKTWNDGAESCVHTARPPERVTVPAGTFMALRVDSNRVDRDFRDRPMPAEIVRWYVVGVGPVKQTITWKLGDRLSRSETVLKSFTLPGPPLPAAPAPRSLPDRPATAPHPRPGASGK